MRHFWVLLGFLLATFTPGMVTPLAASAAPDRATTDVLVTNGSPASTFPRNKQNEPAITINPRDPSVLVAGSNEEIDNRPCVANSCSFTPGVSDNGVYFSFDRGKSWTEPTYNNGWSARTGVAGVGPIGTVPGFYQAGLVGDGDPALAFGPKPGKHGFSWNNGARLYYASLTSDFPGTTTFNAQEAIAVARTDDVRAAAAGNASAWKPIVIASNKLTPDTFSDKESVWVDNAASSPNFGNAYLCWTSFGLTNSPILFARSTDGGATWSDPVTVFDFVPTATTGPTSCTIRSDSTGRVYVFWEQVNSPSLSHQMMARSPDGGQTFGPPSNVADVTEVGKDDPVHTANADPRGTLDGIGGARTFSGLQVDIANGAPSGTDATDQIVMTWSDARRGLNHEEALVQTSRDRGNHWSAPIAVQQRGDRPDFPAVAISPNGTTVYLTYDAFMTPWQGTLNKPRLMQGVIRASTLDEEGALGAFQTLHRGALGDARGSSENNLCCGFLGDYNYVVASRTFGAAVWNDVRNARSCDAVNDWRQSLLKLTKPSPATQCPANFGNTDIYGGVYTLEPDQAGDQAAGGSG